jgi:hypothetical protein
LRCVRSVCCGALLKKTHALVHSEVYFSVTNGKGQLKANANLFLCHPYPSSPLFPHSLYYVRTLPPPLPPSS